MVVVEKNRVCLPFFSLLLSPDWSVRDKKRWRQWFRKKHLILARPDTFQSVEFRVDKGSFLSTASQILFNPFLFKLENFNTPTFFQMTREIFPFSTWRWSFTYTDFFFLSYWLLIRKTSRGEELSTRYTLIRHDRAHLCQLFYDLIVSKILDSFFFLLLLLFLLASYIFQLPNCLVSFCFNTRPVFVDGWPYSHK